MRHRPGQREGTVARGKGDNGQTDFVSWKWPCIYVVINKLFLPMSIGNKAGTGIPCPDFQSGALCLQSVVVGYSLFLPGRQDKEESEEGPSNRLRTERLKGEKNKRRDRQEGVSSAWGEGQKVREYCQALGSRLTGLKERDKDSQNLPSSLGTLLWGFQMNTCRCRDQLSVHDRGILTVPWKHRRRTSNGRVKYWEGQGRFLGRDGTELNFEW